MPRPISVTIHASSLSHNLSTVKQHLQQAGAARNYPAPKVWAVIKARAYGHGVETAVRAFSAADGLAMLDIDEAVQCRDLGWAGPILLLEGFFQAADLPVLARHRVTTMVHTHEQLAMLAAARLPHPLSVWLKLDTGMSRLGFAPAQLPVVMQQVQALQAQGQLQFAGLASHFANADGSAQTTRNQTAVFLQAAQGVPGGLSLCNSAATLSDHVWSSLPADKTQWVRPGICLYGASPFEHRPGAEFGLLPAMTLASELISVRQLPAGASVGYGHVFTATHPMRVGIVACGYADGYPRHAPTGTPVTVHGVRTRLIGRVSMDMLAVDLDPVPAAVVGSPVLLWGKGGPSIDEVAHAAQTIGYELMCAVAPRVPRVHS
jgi:alanine racemase